jgi:CTD nuclear envelope phosphatase 1
MKPPKRARSYSAFIPPQKTPSSTITHTSPDLETQVTLESHVENIIRRIFFIRVFALVWERLRAAWLSLWRRELFERELSPPGVEEVRKGGDEKAIVETSSLEPQAIVLDSHSLIPSSIVSRTTYKPFLAFLKPKQESKSHSLATPSTPQHTALLLRPPESASTSRSPTPVLAARKTPFHLQKTLVLDLDETLIHSTCRPLHTSGSGGGFFGLGSFGGRNKGASHMVEVVLGGRSTLYHVYKRPFVDFFLRTVCPYPLVPYCSN